MTNKPMIYLDCGCCINNGHKWMCEKHLAEQEAFEASQQTEYPTWEEVKNEPNEPE